MTTLIAAWVALGVVGLGAAFMVTAHLAWRDGRLAGHAEMLDAATAYHAQRRIIEADTQPAILAILDAQQAVREMKEDTTRWQPKPTAATHSTRPQWRSEAG